MKIGIICPSEIALRRFMPALQKCEDATFAGIGVYTKEERYGSENISDEEFQESLKIEKEKAQVFTGRRCIYSAPAGASFYMGKKGFRKR